jgi:hypothetical protein
VRHLTLLLLILFAAAAAADDGWIGSGGAPKLMRGHPTISMAREVVNIEIGRSRTVVDAHFWFRNDGPSTTTRVGFPDQESDPETRPVLQNFQSWVAGRKVATKFVHTPDGNWHVKTVRFPARSTIHVQSSYVVKTGMGRIGPAPRFASYAHYVLHTGASWKGPIGEVIVNIRFAEDLPRPLLTNDEMDPALNGTDVAEQDRAIRRHRSTVFTSGPSNAKLRPRVITFYRRNLEPTEDDDIHLTFFLRKDPALEKRIGG